MAQLTPRYKFSYFGAGVPGSITDDGLKFTGLDRLTLDRILSQFETADHHYHGRDTTAVAAPTLTLGTVGTLAPGTTYYYRVAFVSEAGLETSAGPEVSITTPAALIRPDAPTAVSASGGSLSDGLYYYALTATAGTQESILSDAVTVRMVSGDNTAVINVPTLSSGSGVRVWRLREDETTFTMVGTAASGATFTDSGAVASKLNPTMAEQPPSTGRGNYVYSVTVALSNADQSKLNAGSGYKAWRLYRSTVAGSYSSQSLVAQIVERYDEFDESTPLLGDYTDLGEALLAGTPPLADLTLNITPFSFDETNALPDPSLYPQNYPLVAGGQLYLRRGTAWKPLQGANILTGATAPTNDVGATGDLYVRTGTSPAIYGPKLAAGTWSLLTVLGRPGLLSGSGAPANTLGQAGDFYLDTVASSLYGPRSASAWPSTPVQLATAGGSGGSGLISGTAAPSLNVGEVGQYYLRTNTQGNGSTSQTIATLYGPKATLGWPSAPLYLTGVPGTPGVDGLDGAPGAPGPPLNIRGSLPSANNLPTPAVAGDAYFIGADLHVGTATNGWINIGHVQALDSSRRQAIVHFDTLAPQASVSSVAPLAVGYRLLRVSTSIPARVRLYSTTAQRDADVARQAGRDPLGNHGVVLDVVTTADMLTLDLTPQVYGASMEGTPVTDAPLTVTNLGISNGVVVTFTYIRTE